MINGKFVNEINFLDPDSNAIVHLSIYKLETGGIIGIDSSFLETELPVYSPFDKGVEINPSTFE